MEIKITAAREIVNDYYRNKMDACRLENINIGRVLAPNRLMHKHGT
jgi:hypothetical protein